MNTGRIINSKTNGKFTVVPNDLINDDLTFEEKGLLISLLSLPSDWIIYRNNLYDRFPDKPGTIDRIFQQLQNKGYIISVRVIDDIGHFKGWNHIVYNEKRDSSEISRKPQLPTSVNAEVGEHRNRQTPKSVITEVGKRGAILNTNYILNTNSIQKTNEERDLAWFKNQLDNIFLDRMKLLHNGKDIEQAIKEAFGHLLANDIELADKRRCQTLLNSWLSNQKPAKNKSIDEADFLNMIK